MVAVMLGTTFFDGFSRTSIWQNRYYNVQVDLLDRPSLADLVGQLMSVGGMLACVAFVGLAFRLAVRGTESIAEPATLSQEFIDSLIPIALVYIDRPLLLAAPLPGRGRRPAALRPVGPRLGSVRHARLPAELHVPDPAHDLVRPGRRARHRPRRRARGRARPRGRPLPARRGWRSGRSTRCSC